MALFLRLALMGPGLNGQFSKGDRIFGKFPFSSESTFWYVKYACLRFKLSNDEISCLELKNGHYIS